MTTSLMLSTCLSLFILLNAFHLFNCVEHSDWTYDRETGLVNTTIANGTTYSCRAWDIIDRAGPSLKKMLPTDGRVCLDPDQSENDTGCIHMDFIKVFSAMSDYAKANENRSACIYPVPTEEEVFEKIEKIYRSSLDVELPTTEWFTEVVTNITSMRVEYSKNEVALKEIEYARNITLYALHNRVSRLPEQRKEVSRLQIKFEETKSNLTEQRNSTDALDESETFDLRSELLSNEINALRDSYEFELYDWYILAQQRVLFVKKVLVRKLTEFVTNGQDQVFVEYQRMQMLAAMAEANEIVAHTEYLMREVEYRFNEARQSTEVDKDLIEE